MHDFTCSSCARTQSPNLRNHTPIRAPPPRPQFPTPTRHSQAAQSPTGSSMQLSGLRAAALGERSSWSSPTSGYGLDSPTSSARTATGERRTPQVLQGSSANGREGPASPRIRTPHPCHRSASDCSRLAVSRLKTEQVAPASPHRSRLAFAVAAIALNLVALVSRLALRRLDPMAPQRRGPPRVPEGNSAAERRRANR